MTAITQTATADVRATSPRDRHALIFGTFTELLPGVWRVRVDRIASCCA